MPDFEWSAAPEGEALVGRPRGRVDEATWEVFLEALSGAVVEAGEAGKALVIDLSGLDYMSSRGLRALTIAKRDADARLVAIRLARPSDRMREILAISRYDKIFTVEAN